MEMKAGLTFACMNLKKLAKILEKRSQRGYGFLDTLRTFVNQPVFIEKWCWG